MDVSRILEAAVKAPLWLYFAVAVASGLPLLNLPFLIDAGVTPILRIGPIPVGFVFVCSSALFASSLAARSMTFVLSGAAKLGGRLGWEYRIRTLPQPARGVLAYLEELNEQQLRFPPDNAPVRRLRDLGLVRADLVDQNQAWAVLQMGDELAAALVRWPGLRRALRVDKETMSAVRQGVTKAMHARRRQF
jgi:hypothetical protein